MLNMSNSKHDRTKKEIMPNHAPKHAMPANVYIHPTFIFQAIESLLI